MISGRIEVAWFAKIYLLVVKFGNDPVPLFSRIRNNKYTANYIQIVQFIITDIITWIKDAIATVN